MAKILFNVFFKIITSFVNIILAPINALIVNLFPSLATIINAFNSAVVIYVGGGISYFMNLIPPTSRTLIILWVTILLSYYGIILGYHLIVKILHIIKKIKVW